MRKYIQMSPAEKLKLLNEHACGVNWKSLDETKWCMHCDAQFTGHSARVYIDAESELWLECGTPDCDGSPIDWAEYPWWDENHPETQAHDAAMEKLTDITESGEPENN
jgi:hypothetical protein